MTPPQHRIHLDIVQLFAEEKAKQPGFLRVSAPMVRYSKLEFRRLLRLQGVKLTFTPMIIADSFNNSQKARDNEFTTALDDQPLIAQFAACNAEEFATAAQLIYPYVDGVDLNCGCPQSWAIAKQYGCGLLRQPEIVRDIVQTTRRRLPRDFSISVKMRLLSRGAGEEEPPVHSTVELARQLEHCGVTFLTLHGRNTWQRAADPVNVAAIAAVKQALHVPLIANGDVRSWQDACRLQELTKADGIMAARGLLSNPTLFNPACQEHRETCLYCVQQWLDIAISAGDNIQFQCFHHHLTFMWSSNMKRHLRIQFNSLTKKSEIYDFFAEQYGLKPAQQSSQLASQAYTKCSYAHFSPPKVQAPLPFAEPQWNANTQGAFFNEFNEEIQTGKRDEFELEGSFLTEEVY